MKLTNKTAYNTATLNRLFADAMRLIKKDFALDWSRVKKLRVLVRNARRTFFVSGHAFYNKPVMQLNIPTKWNGAEASRRNNAKHNEGTSRSGYANGILVQAVAATFLHEIGHNLGVHHVKPENANWHCATIEHKYDAWIDSLTDEAYPLNAPPVVKVKPDARMVRYERAVLNFKQAETRLKRAKTIHKKWQQKIRYYERTLPQAAMPTKAK